MDFSLNAEQLALREKARLFATTRLAEVGGLIVDLPTPEARFAATRPIYEELVREGFLHRLIPLPFGGGGTGVVDMAMVAEEFFAADVNVPLTMLANLLGLTPVFVAGTPEQQRKWLAPFLSRQGAPLAALCNSEPGGSANFDAAPPADGTRTQARLENGRWVIDGRKQWVSSATGWDGRGADILTVVCRTPAPDAPTAPSPSSAWRDQRRASTGTRRAIHGVPWPPDVALFTGARNRPGGQPDRRARKGARHRRRKFHFNRSPGRGVRDRADPRRIRLRARLRAAREARWSPSNPRPSGRRLRARRRQRQT